MLLENKCPFWACPVLNLLSSPMITLRNSLHLFLVPIFKYIIKCQGIRHFFLSYTIVINGDDDIRRLFIFFIMCICAFHCDDVWWCMQKCEASDSPCSWSVGSCKLPSMGYGNQSWALSKSHMISESSPFLRKPYKYFLSILRLHLIFEYTYFSIQTHFLNTYINFMHCPVIKPELIFYGTILSS